MNQSLGAVFPIPASKKASARAALVDMKEPTRKLLTECFQQFGIQPVALNGNAVERFKTEKFEACVVKLGPAAESVMASVRTAPSNSRMVIYGLGGSVQDAMRFSKFGINAVFNEPLERTAALKMVRATQMLVLHEFRRYVRIPIITEISVSLPDNRQVTASSLEISAGGMSLRSSEDVSIGQAVEISFELLTLPRIWVRAAVSWRNAASKSFGIRFDAQDQRRLRVKQWIETHLEA
jgi:hypothetical protein